MTPTKLSLALMTSVLVVSATASPLQGVYFSPKLGESDEYVASDWELVCDNIHTCRAYGYYDDDKFDWDDDKNQIISMLIKRQMGNKAQGFINFGMQDDQMWERFFNDVIKTQNKTPELFVGGASYGQVGSLTDAGIAGLTDGQLSAILSQMGSDFDVYFVLGNYRWTLSGVGLMSVLDKMDEVQGHVHTPVAFIQKGSQTAPTQKYAYPVLNDKPFLSNDEKTIKRNSKEGQKLIKLLTSSLPKDSDYAECTVLMDDKDIDEYERDETDFTSIKVAKDKTLIMGRCWSGAYNLGLGAWLVDSRHTKLHQAIDYAVSFVDKNQLISAQKVRGLGDCWSDSAWTWDGTKFVQTYDGHTGQCRGFVGGAWQLPALVVDVMSDKGDLNRVLQY
ncbi:MAG: DUF1176 domain-containing protein [Moraxella sp.]|nr:DUF1176 domain-containing protein [Moraxella sp.]